jgi:hypothetical protein
MPLTQQRFQWDKVENEREREGGGGGEREREREYPAAFPVGQGQIIILI